MKSSGLTLLAAVVAAALPSYAEDGNTNLVQETRKWINVGAYADIETAYWARGAIVDKRPFSAQFADLSIDLDPFGRIGGYAWSVSSLSKSGQSATRRNAYNGQKWCYWDVGLTRSWKFRGVVRIWC